MKCTLTSSAWIPTKIWNIIALVNNIFSKPIMNHFYLREDFYRHENWIIMVCRVVEKPGDGGVKTRNSSKGGRCVGVEEEVLTAPLGAVVVNCWCDYDTTSQWRAMAARGAPFRPVLSWKLTALFRSTCWKSLHCSTLITITIQQSTELIKMF